MHSLRERTCTTRSTKHDTRLFPHKSVLQPSLKRSDRNRRIGQLLSPHSLVVLRICGLTSSLRMSGHPTVLFPQGSGDVGFAGAFRRLPEPLRVALVEHELDDAGIFEAFPRKPLALLGILGADGRLLLIRVCLLVVVLVFYVLWPQDTVLWYFCFF